MRHDFASSHLFARIWLARMRAVLAVGALLVVAGCPVQAERYPIKKYTAADGLVQNSVNRIVIDSRGYIWICTNEGFSRFDGYQFVSFGVEQGLPHRVVRDLLETGDGQYWLATNGGLVRFNPIGTPTRNGYASNGRVPMFTLYRLPIDQQDRPVISLARGPAGTIWCGTGSGLFQLVEENGSFTLRGTSLVSATDDRYYVRSMLATSGGAVWVGLSNGLIRYQVGSEVDGRIESFGEAEGLPDMEISRIYQDRAGRLWAGTGRGLFELDPNPVPGSRIVRQQITVGNGLPGDWVRDIWQMPDADYWVATDRGLARFRLSSEGRVSGMRRYLVENGLSDYFLTCLVSGADGNLWLGTANAGLMKWVYNGFTTYGQADGLASSVSVFRALNGQTIVAGYVLRDHLPGHSPSAPVPPRSQPFQWRLGTLENDTFVWIRPNVPAAASFTSGWNQISFQDREGDWWIPTSLGLYRFAATRSLRDLATAPPKAVYTTRDGLANNAITRLFEDSRGDIWIATSQQNINHLDRWERATGRIVPVSRRADQALLQNRQVTALAEDRQGTVWLGLSHSIIPGGLARCVDDRITLIDDAQGPRGNVQSLIFDSTGRLWAASTTQGLIRLDQPTAARLVFRYYGKEEGLLSNRVTSLVEDLYGRIYVGTARGLDQIDPSSGQIHHFNQDDGMALGSVDDLYRDASGDLWIATTQGLSRYSPIEAPTSLPPPIYIDRIRVGGEDYQISALGETELHLAELPSTANQIELQYVGLSFFTGDNLSYQTRLEGVDSDWVDRGTNRTINYVNLGPGSYRLHLRAINARGEISPRPALVAFSIAAPFYLRWWFFLLVIAVPVLIGYLVILLRFRQKLRLERLRTQISGDLHDEVGSSLSQIAILTEVALSQSVTGAPAEARDANLRKVADISRTAIDSMEEIVWAVDPRRDTLNDLVQRMRRFAGETLAMRGNLELQFTAPPGDLQLHVKVRRHLFLIFKEVINNIARHSEATAVRVEIAVDGSTLRLRVDDNGRGFVETDLDPHRKGGNGLPGLRRRARILGATIRIDSNHGLGTAVTLEVPLRRGGLRTYINR